MLISPRLEPCLAPRRRFEESCTHGTQLTPVCAGDEDGLVEQLADGLRERRVL